MNDRLLIKINFYLNKLFFSLDDSNFEGEKVFIMVHKNNYCRDSKRISIGGSPYNWSNVLITVEIAFG